MPYERIESYGVIGNMRTAALVSQHGSIDWLCFPHFDSPSVFAALLDDEKGGRFSIEPADAVRDAQAALLARHQRARSRAFFRPTGVGEIDDFMPCGGRAARVGGPDRPARLASCAGRSPFEIVVRARVRLCACSTEDLDHRNGAVFAGPRHDASRSRATFRCARRSAGPERSSRCARARSTRFVLRGMEPVRNVSGARHGGGQATRAFEETVRFWRRWLVEVHLQRPLARDRPPLGARCSSCSPSSRPARSSRRRRAACPRSSAALRNWDYRYTWIRDAAFTLYALLRIGFTEEAAALHGAGSRRAAASAQRRSAAADRLRHRRAERR